MSSLSASKLYGFSGISGSAVPRSDTLNPAGIVMNESSWSLGLGPLDERTADGGGLAPAGLEALLGGVAITYII